MSRMTQQEIREVAARHMRAATPQGLGVDHQAILAAQSGADVPRLLEEIRQLEQANESLRSRLAATTPEVIEQYRDLSHYGKQAGRLHEAREALARVEAVCADEWGSEADCECCPASSDAWVVRPLITRIREAMGEGR